MHAVRNTIGYTPTAPKAADKQESRVRFYTGAETSEARNSALVALPGEDIEAWADRVSASISDETLAAYLPAIRLGLVDFQVLGGDVDVRIFAALVEAGLVK